MAQESTTILHIEDSPEDHALTARALKKTGHDLSIIWRETADDAMALFMPEADGERPALIILDLDIPGTDGREFLKWLRSDEERRLIPVMMMTSSQRPEDISYCYREGACGYIVKPTSPAEMVRVIQAAMTYWLETVSLPAGE